MHDPIIRNKNKLWIGVILKSTFTNICTLCLDSAGTLVKRSLIN